MFGPDIFVAPKMTKGNLYDIEDPNEMFGAHRTPHGSYNHLNIVLPQGPDVVGFEDQVFWYDFQTSLI